MARFEAVDARRQVHAGGGGGGSGRQRRRQRRQRALVNQPTCLTSSRMAVVFLDLFLSALALARRCGRGRQRGARKVPEGLFCYYLGSQLVLNHCKGIDRAAYVEGGLLLLHRIVPLSQRLFQPPPQL